MRQESRHGRTVTMDRVRSISSKLTKKGAVLFDEAEKYFRLFRKKITLILEKPFKKMVCCQERLFSCLLARDKDLLNPGF